MRKPFASGKVKDRRYCLLLLGLLPLLGVLISAAPARAENPLTANIGWSTSANGPWSTSDTITTTAGTTIYFHARNSGNSGDAMTDDLDCPPKPAPKVLDTANYSWDWNYVAGTHDDNATGVSVSKTYNTPGNRVVQLKVWDNAGTGKTNDIDGYDTVTVRIKLVLETDSMAAGANCTAADHVPIYTSTITDYMSYAWGDANYTLAVDQDHSTNCTHYEFIADSMDYTQICYYLNSYEKSSPSPHLYIMGGHHYMANDDCGGATWQSTWGMIFMFAGEVDGIGVAQYYPQVAAGVMLHENACHDSTVGAIGHCTSAVQTCACKNIDSTSQITFCASCLNELRSAQTLGN
jgi:hypothetical protein